MIRLKFTLIACFLLCQQGLSAQPVSEEAEIKLVRSFLEAMKSGDDLHQFISPQFLKDTQSKERAVNFFLISEFRITKTSDLVYDVEIDHGKGVFCTRIVLQVVSENSNLYIKPSSIENDLIIPWQSKKKICP